MGNYRMRWAAVSDDRVFPTKIAEVLQSASGAHSHEFFEIVYVVEGFMLHALGGESALLLAGDIIAVRPGDEHFYHGRRTATIINFLFLPEALGSALSEVCALPGMADFFAEGPSSGWKLHAHLELEDRERVLALFHEMQEERAAQKTGWVVRSRALLVEFMVLLSRVFSARFPASRMGDSAYTGYVSRAMELIEADYAIDLSIADIARQVGVSADHLTRQFNRTLGITPSEYLRRFRFARAIELLRQQTAVGDVSRMVSSRKVTVALLQRLMAAAGKGVTDKDPLAKDIIGALMGGSTPIRTMTTTEAMLSMMPEPAKADKEKLSYSTSFAAMMAGFSKVGLSNMTYYVLPGTAATSNKVEYFSPHKAELTALLTKAFNPYGRAITEADLLLTELTEGGETDVHEQKLSELALDQTGDVTPGTTTPSAAA